MALFRPYERPAAKQDSAKPDDVAPAEKSTSSTGAAKTAKTRSGKPSSVKASSQARARSHPAAEVTASEVTASEVTASEVTASEVTGAEVTEVTKPTTAEQASSSETQKPAPVRKGYTPKKDRPTPTREAAEAARLERLHPTLSEKERKKQAREAARLRRVDAFARAEDEPTKVLLRDYIDARWTATEFMIPVMLLLLAANIAFMRNFLITQIISGLVVVVFVVWMINLIIVWRGFKKEARARLKEPKFQQLLLYANSRMMTIRRFRRPGPRIERGADY